MKRIKSLLVSALMVMGTAGAFAQVDNTFQFVDKGGNVVADGSTCTFNAEKNQWTGAPEAKIGLSVKNTTDAEAYISMNVVTEKLPNGNIQVCFPDECVSEVPADFITGNGIIAANGLKPLNSEWLPEEGKYGTAEVTLQLRVMTQTGTFPNYKYAFKANGPKIKVNLVYSDPTGIATLAADKDAVVNVYDLAGKAVLTNRPASALLSLGKGLYICETVKNGKRVAVKKIVR